MKVLIVDDDQSKTKMIATALCEAGIELSNLEHVTTARQARVRLRSDRYDLVLIDVAIPDSIESDIDRRGGIELMRDVYTQDSYFPPTCTIGVTGFGELVEQSRRDFSMWGVAFVYFDPSGNAWREVIQNAARVCIRRTQKSPRPTYLTDLAIVCALSTPELEAILANGWKWTQIPITSEHWQFHSTELEYENHRFQVRACACPRMGTESATIAAMKMIEYFRPKFLAMTGIAAGVRGRGNPGDIVAADPAWNWGCGKWIRRGEESEFLPSPHQLPLDATIRGYIDALRQDTHSRQQKSGDVGAARSQILHFQVLIGPMATAGRLL
ncbi:MAG: hypothetical protein IPN01_29580 [Deltaproteobacteria bacterium]|nr:hypothetical protein [Deltaproteobacteria bacterium]